MSLGILLGTPSLFLAGFIIGLQRAIRLQDQLTQFRKSAFSHAGDGDCAEP